MVTICAYYFTRKQRKKYMAKSCASKIIVYLRKAIANIYGCAHTINIKVFIGPTSIYTTACRHRLTGRGNVNCFFARLSIQCLTAKHTVLCNFAVCRLQSLKYMALLQQIYFKYRFLVRCIFRNINIFEDTIHF